MTEVCGYALLFSSLSTFQMHYSDYGRKQIIVSHKMFFSFIIFPLLVFALGDKLMNKL